MDTTPLRDVIARLRHPETGCPWDRKQKLADLMTPLRNEVEELAAAVAEADAPHIQEELGDVLFNVFMVLRVAEEDGLFEPGAAMAGVMEKMIRRHPHVFSDAKAVTEEEARALYQAAKRQERA